MRGRGPAPETPPRGPTPVRSPKTSPEAVPAREVAGEPFTLPHFRAWCRTLELDNGKPFILEPFQEWFVKDLFAGIPECWLIIPEGNGKTTLFAALALYHCKFKRNASVPIAASSRDQAQIMYDQADGFVVNSGLTEFKCLPGYRRIRHDGNRSRIQVFAADERTGDGPIPTLALIDELHRHRDLKLYRTWRGKLQKRKGQIVTISTAGEPGSEFELTRAKIRQLTRTVRRAGSFVRAVSRNIAYHEWAVPEGADVEDLKVVKTANPLKSITIAMLREKLATPTMTLPHWRRFTCNLPTRSESAAITEAEWEAAKIDDHIPEGVPVYIGLDVGWKYDTTALVPYWQRDSEFRLFGPATILVPPRNGDTLDPDLIEDAIRKIHKRNPIHTVVMDPTKAEQLGAWIGTNIGAVVIEHSKTNPQAVADYNAFMEALREGWLHHTGDPGLTQHVLNAIAKVLPLGDVKFERPDQSRLGQEQERRVIDALDAAAMVHSVASAPAEVIEESQFAWR